MEMTQEQKVYEQVVQKAWEDAQFKKDLMVNPVETLENFTGSKLNLPSGKTLVVNDQTNESTIYLNIPGKVSTDTVELTDDQLEMVAGGAEVPYKHTSDLVYDIFYNATAWVINNV